MGGKGGLCNISISRGRFTTHRIDLQEPELATDSGEKLL
jgi:hypothetical protein